VSEPDRGRRDWQGKPEERDAVYANRRRIRGKRGKALLRRRGELIERSFAHVLETGGMRRTHLKGHTNILKRMLLHVSGFNLSLVMRKLIGRGTPRGLQGLFLRLIGLLWTAYNAIWRAFTRITVVGGIFCPLRYAA
jgi:transposase